MYKNILILAVALTTACNVYAQTQKGDHLIGGSLSASTADGSNNAFGYAPAYTGATKSKFISIGPTYSYFIADGLDLGISASLSYQKSKTNTNINVPVINEQTSRGSFVGAYLRKYFLYEGKFGVRTGPFASYSYVKQNYTYPNYSNVPSYFGNNKVFNAGVGLDLAFFPVKRFGLLASIGSLSYYHAKGEQIGEATKENGVGLNFLTSELRFSAVYAFGR